MSNYYNIRKHAEIEEDYPFQICPNCLDPLNASGKCSFCEEPDPADIKPLNLDADTAQNVYYTPTFSEKGLRGFQIIADTAYRNASVSEFDEYYDPYDPEQEDPEDQINGQTNIGTIIQLIDNAQLDENGMYSIHLNQIEWNYMFTFIKILKSTFERVSAGEADEFEYQSMPEIFANQVAVATAIWEFASTSSPEGSSDYNLEDIPTMDENPIGHLGRIAAVSIAILNKFKKSEVIQFPGISDHHKMARDLIRNDRDTYNDIDDPDSLSDEEIGELINERYDGGWDTFVADNEEYANAKEHKSPGIPPVTFAGKMNKQEMDVASGNNVVPFPLNRGASFRTCASCNMVLSENEIKISKELLPNYSCHKCIIALH